MVVVYRRLMKRGAIFVAVTATLAVVMFGLWAWLAPAPVRFTFAMASGTGTMTYHCANLGSAEQTEENARAGHAFFWSGLSDIADRQAKAMQAVMSSGKSSAEIASVLAALNDESDAQRKALHRELRSRFRCSYTGST